MLGHIAEPLDAGRLEADVGIEAAGDGLVDDRLLLLLQQRNQLPLRAHIPPNATVHVVQVPDDGGLLMEGWPWKWLALQELHWNAHAVCQDAIPNANKALLE